MPPQSSVPPSAPPFRHSPLLPTGLESLLLAVYPATLVLGSLFSLLDPSARATYYNASSQAHAQPPSYFAEKRNIFNVLFVKIGWFWVTLAYTIFLFPSPILTPRRLQGLLRYGLVTLYWIAVTQWFFGPPLIDRLFTLTGGLCDREGVASSAACKAVGGKWTRGHDVSGHVFLLALGSTFLWMEALHVVLRGSGARDERLIASGPTIKRAEAERQGVDLQEYDRSNFGVKVVIVIAGLCWWMLLMTAAYFHTWFEKVGSSLDKFAVVIS